MSSQKTVNAKIFNPENDEFLSEITVTIILITPSNPRKLPEYEVFGRINKTCVDYDNQVLMLEITSSLRDKARFTINGIPEQYTEYRIWFEEQSWKNLEWFNNL